MTQHEQVIRAHCQQKGIRIEVRPSGAIRFTGYGVNITAVDFACVVVASLTPCLDDVHGWPALERKA